MSGHDDKISPVGFNEEVHQPFDVQAHQGQYAMWKLLGALGFLIALALIVFFVYQPGARDRHDPVVISPNKTALKTPPAEKIIDPIKDKSIYGAGLETNPANAINPEAPIKLPQQIQLIETTPSAAPTPAPQPLTQPIITQPKAPTSAYTKPLPPSGTQTNVTNGNHLVQVASLRSYEEAEAAWNRITKKFTFLKGQAYDIKRVDLNEKGVYYRLRIAGLSSTASADSVCRKLQANDQACFKTSR